MSSRKSFKEVSGSSSNLGSDKSTFAPAGLHSVVRGISPAQPFSPTFSPPKAINLQATDLKSPILPNNLPSNSSFTSRRGSSPKLVQRAATTGFSPSSIQVQGRFARRATTDFDSNQTFSGSSLTAVSDSISSPASPFGNSPLGNSGKHLPDITGVRLGRNNWIKGTPPLHGLPVSGATTDNFSNSSNVYIYNKPQEGEEVAKNSTDVVSAFSDKVGNSPFMQSIRRNSQNINIVGPLDLSNSALDSASKLVANPVAATNSVSSAVVNPVSGGRGVSNRPDVSSSDEDEEMIQYGKSTTKTGPRKSLETRKSAAMNTNNNDEEGHISGDDNDIDYYAFPIATASPVQTVRSQDTNSSNGSPRLSAAESGPSPDTNSPSSPAGAFKIGHAHRGGKNLIVKAISPLRKPDHLEHKNQQKVSPFTVPDRELPKSTAGGKYVGGVLVGSSTKANAKTGSSTTNGTSSSAASSSTPTSAPKEEAKVSWFLTKFGAANLAEYRYVSGDYSLLDSYLNPWWMWCAGKFPYSISPNMITSVGTVIQILTVLLMVWDQGKSYWPSAVAAIGMFLYQTLDAIDGKHARNTGQTTPLGSLFDHGCDAISMGVSTTYTALRLGQLALDNAETSLIKNSRFPKLIPGMEQSDFVLWVQYSAVLTAGAAFLVRQWEHYHTGFLETRGCSEAQYMVIGVMLLFAHPTTTARMASPVAYLGDWYTVFLFVFFLFALGVVWTTIGRVWCRYLVSKRKNWLHPSSDQEWLNHWLIDDSSVSAGLKYSQRGSPVFNMIPWWILIGMSYGLFLTVYKLSWLKCTLIISLSYTYLSLRSIVCGLCAESQPYWFKSLVPLYLIFITIFAIWTTNNKTRVLDPKNVIHGGSFGLKYGLNQKFCDMLDLLFSYTVGAGYRLVYILGDFVTRGNMPRWMVMSGVSLPGTTIRAAGSGGMFGGGGSVGGLISFADWSKLPESLTTYSKLGMTLTFWTTTTDSLAGFLSQIVGSQSLIGLKFPVLRPILIALTLDSTWLNIAMIYQSVLIIWFVVDVIGVICRTLDLPFLAPLSKPWTKPLVTKLIKKNQ